MREKENVADRDGYHYEDPFGFAFSLPKDYKRAEYFINPSFPGTRFFISNQDLIGVMPGEIQDHLVDPTRRREEFRDYLKSLKFNNITFLDYGTLGGEGNTLVAEYEAGGRRERMISSVQRNIQYLIRYEGNLDDASRKALEQLMSSFRFPSADQAIKAKQPSRSFSHKEQTLLDVLRARSPEDARRVLSQSGMPPVIERHGYTMHRLDQETGKKNLDRKWWQFWR